MSKVNNAATFNSTSLGFLVGYIALLTYGTWFPLDRWNWSAGGIDQFLHMTVSQSAPLSDLIINILVYAPVGALLAHVLRAGPLIAALCSALLGFVVSVTLEFGQTYIPGRVTSLLDILLNTSGAFLGAFFVGHLRHSRKVAEIYARVHAQLRHPGSGRLGLLVLVFWLASQWAPFFPSLDIGYLRASIARFVVMAADPQAFFILHVFKYALMFVGLSAIALRMFEDRQTAAKYFAGGVFLVLAGKLFIVTRLISPESVIGAFIAVIVTLRLRSLSSPFLQVSALAALAIFQVLDTWLPGLQSSSPKAMNWILFRGQMNSLNGIVDLLGSVWLYSAYAYLTYPRRSRSTDGLVIRLIAFATWAFILEWGQSKIPGRYADITDVVVGLTTYILCYSYPWRSPAHTAINRRRSSASPWQKAVSACLTGLLVLFVVGRLVPQSKPDSYRLPDVTELPNALLPSFRYQHPRFEAPSNNEWALLQRENPDFVKRIQQGADRGRLYSRILLARVSPDLGVPQDLFNDLLALEFDWRGHQQTIPIALAYDWLYDRFDEVQRGRMLAKLELACKYQIDVIKDRLKLSPYNVYLYNQPLQALIMAAIAQHGDSESGQCMRFANDYWKHRVLPVWSQVMGLNGGWHEGAEYVGIGIGSAIHRLPAMWRHATGEDLFASMPGLRGFLDFAVYRKQPDGSDMRLGDGAFHRNNIPDLAALAVEFDHAAAYTLATPPTEPQPLGFPWGTWSNESLRDLSARSRLPLAKWFDGIGLLVARSDWSENASYLTFKAGDNFWSHMHLDQGSFTLFKEQALALDSGVYYNYGGEHHMNYMYQSIAHNVVTIVDPQENRTLPGKTKERKDGSTTTTPERTIANDGGQRRVGSGWGRPAPLDYTDWKLQLDHYKTVGEVLVDTSEDAHAVWVNADLTPAYTNSNSGSGDFWSRSHRTDHYLRTFVYIPKLDVALIHDRVSLSAGGLRTKWLLHSSEKPHLSNGALSIPKDDVNLHTQILIPRNAQLNLIGGPGYEFFVDGKNYDEDGKIAKALKRKAKAEIVPGAWRTEVSSPMERRQQDFLVLLQPGTASEPAPTLNIEVTETTKRLDLKINELTIYLPKGLEPVQAITAER